MADSCPVYTHLLNLKHSLESTIQRCLPAGLPKAQSIVIWHLYHMLHLHSDMATPKIKSGPDSAAHILKLMQYMPAVHSRQASNESSV